MIACNMRTMTDLSLLAAVVLAVAVSTAAAADLTDKQTIQLWQGQAPGQQGDQPADIPVVQVFLPAAEKASGAAFVVCAGGGYGGLAQHEGPVVGQWFADHGVTAFVLRYRLGPKYHHPVELGDAQRALRLVRANAKEWKLDPDRIGIMGFSAGGHLASTAATHFNDGDPKSADPIERVSCRPNLQILIYPVITMGQATHAGSRNNLLGRNPSPELIELLSNEKQVTDKTPPAFLVHSITDTVVPVSNSDRYAAALKEKGIACEYVRLETGQHGVGLRDTWTPQCLAWLAKNKFIAAAAAK